MVDLSCLWIGPSPDNSFYEYLIRDIEEDEAVGRRSAIFQCVGLGLGTRETI
jgi:hypothetical protein